MRQVTFYEVLRNVYDWEWDRYDTLIVWTDDPTLMDIRTGNTRIVEMP